MRGQGADISEQEGGAHWPLWRSGACSSTGDFEFSIHASLSDRREGKLELYFGESGKRSSQKKDSGSHPVGSGTFF